MQPRKEDDACAETLTKTHSQVPCCLQHAPLRHTKAPQTRQSAGSFGTFLQAVQAFLW